MGRRARNVSRLRNRIETVINATKAAALADNSNPARQALWSNHHNPADRATLKYAGLNGKTKPVALSRDGLERRTGICRTIGPQAGLFGTRANADNSMCDADQ